MRDALKNFKTDLANIDLIATLLSSPGALASDMLAATIAIRCGAVVLLSGHLESFLRECLRRFIVEINALGKPWNTIPAKMKHTHFLNGAKVLQKQLAQDKQNGDTRLCENLAARIASVNVSHGYQLAWEAFTETRANPGPEVIKQLLLDVGIENSWEKLNAETSPGFGNLRLSLTSFVTLRNECAHSGIATSPPTVSEIKQYGENLVELATAIVTVLERHVETIRLG